MAKQAQVFRLPMGAPDDVSTIKALITDGELDPDGIVAILGKTEGNGCVNDFTRGFATQSLRHLLGQYLTPARIEQIPLIMSGGTEGGLSPHWIVLSQTEAAPSDIPALAIAGSVTRMLSAAEIGRKAQAHLVQRAVREAMTKAGITAAEDVHYVQVKCPLLTAERAALAKGDVSTTNMLKSMGLSRGASALGVALALGEIDQVGDNQIGQDLSLWSSRAACSAGIELMSCEIVVMGQSQDWSGPLGICHGVMQDAIDAAAISPLLAEIGDGSVLAALAKAEASNTGTIRGHRHTMLEDSDLSSTRHARGFVGGLLAGLIGHTQLFVSGGAEHQGPDGGGPVALIYVRQTERHH